MRPMPNLRPAGAVSELTQVQPHRSKWRILLYSSVGNSHPPARREDTIGITGTSLGAHWRNCLSSWIGSWSGTGASCGRESTAPAVSGLRRLCGLIWHVAAAGGRDGGIGYRDPLRGQDGAAGGLAGKSPELPSEAFGCGIPAAILGRMGTGGIYAAALLTDEADGAGGAPGVVDHRAPSGFHYDSRDQRGEECAELTATRPLCCLPPRLDTEDAGCHIGMQSCRRRRNSQNPAVLLEQTLRGWVILVQLRLGS